jgi:hypothetical protein
MERYTVKSNDTYMISSEHYNEAINKLGAFENVIEELLLKQEEISKELKALRSEEKTKSVRFRQLLGNKLTNSALVTIFERHGLIDKK